MDTILVVADDGDLYQAVAATAAPAGFRVELTQGSETGLEMAVSGRYALVLVALWSCGVHASFDFLRSVRWQAGTPIVILTARAEDVDRILALEMGADDCLSAPFNPRELLARIHAILRRVRGAVTGFQGRPHAFAMGDISIDPGRRQVHRAGEVIELTAAEFQLLEMLMRNAGRVVRRDALADPVLGRAPSARDRSIDTHVSRLRKKLGHERPGAERIKTIRNVGYLYVVPSESDDRQASGGESSAGADAVREPMAFHSSCSVDVSVLHGRSIVDP